MKGPLHCFKKNSGLNMSRRSLIGSPARTTLKDVGNLRVNDDQAEKAARRMSVYPIKGGLGDRDAPTTPFKSPFKSGAHLREFTSATPGAAAQMLSPSRLGDLYQNCIKLSNENVRHFNFFCSRNILVNHCSMLPAQVSPSALGI